jgi:hypothetical protein
MGKRGTYPEARETTDRIEGILRRRPQEDSGIS